MNRLVSYFFPPSPGGEHSNPTDQLLSSSSSDPVTDTLPTHQHHVRPGPHPPQLPSTSRAGYRTHKHRPPSTLITIEEIDSNYGSSSSVIGSGGGSFRDKDGEGSSTGRSNGTIGSMGGGRCGSNNGCRRGSSALSLPEGMYVPEDGHQSELDQGQDGLEETERGKTADGKTKGKGRAIDHDETEEDLNISGLSNVFGPISRSTGDGTPESDPTPRPSHESSPTQPSPKPSRNKHVDRELTPKRGRGRGRGRGGTTMSSGNGLSVRHTPDVEQASRLLLELGEETVRGLPNEEEVRREEGEEVLEEEEVMIVSRDRRRRGSGGSSIRDDTSLRSINSLTHSTRIGTGMNGRRRSGSNASEEGERGLEVIVRRVDRSPYPDTRTEGRRRGSIDSLPGHRNYGATTTNDADKKDGPADRPALDPSKPFSSDPEGGEIEGEPPPDSAPLPPFYRRPLFMAGVKLAILFALFTGVLVGTLWFGIPPLEGEDRGKIKLPRSFADLKDLTGLFQKYKTLFPFRLCSVGIVGYLYVQTFSLPGSMYISILFGAAYGMFYGLLLSCLCEATGALFCYSLSAVLGPPLLEIPAYRSRLETWRTKIMGDKTKGEAVGWDGVFAFLIVLRIAPFPPHWITNVVAPHLDIFPILFWSACFIGIGPVSVIHVTIGSGLDQMTSADDFHILSLRNILGLIGVGVAVMIPVGLKRVFKKDLSNLNEAEDLLRQPHIQIHPPSSQSNDGAEIGSPSSRYLQDLEDGYLSSSSSFEHLEDSEGGRSYQAEDLGLVLGRPRGFSRSKSPSRKPYTYSQPYPDTISSRSRQRAPMDLEQALDLIRDAKDEEVLAVVYADEVDGGEIIEGLYKGGVGRVLDSDGLEDEDVGDAVPDRTMLANDDAASIEEREEAEGDQGQMAAGLRGYGLSAMGGKSALRRKQAGTRGYGTIPRDDATEADVDDRSSVRTGRSVRSQARTERFSEGAGVSFEGREGDELPVDPNGGIRWTDVLGRWIPGWTWASGMVWRQAEGGR